MPSHVEKKAAVEAATKPRDYTRRQMIALQRPEHRDPVNWMACNDPHKREVQMVKHHGTPIQLISVLTVDLDDWPTWHARVGFMQAHGDDADYFLPIRTWGTNLEQLASRAMKYLVSLPREVEKCTYGRRPAGRPTNIHCFIPLTSMERDWMTVLSGEFTEPVVNVRDPRKLPGDD